MLDVETTTTETRTRTRERTPIQFRRTERLPRRTSVAVTTTSYTVPERSRTTGLVIQVILGAAACLALVGVVDATQQQQTPVPAVSPGSPEAPPPAVFVQVAD